MYLNQYHGWGHLNQKSNLIQRDRLTDRRTQPFIVKLRISMRMVWE